MGKSLCRCNSWVLLLAVFFAFVGCKAKKGNQNGETGTAVAMRYAEQIRIDSCDGYFLVNVRNPWDTAKILHTYVLVERSRELPADLPEGTVVRTPLSKALVYSSVHCSLLVELGALDCIGGVCDFQYIYHSAVRARCEEGKIVDAGNAMSPNLEKVIDFHPDAVLLSPFENSGGYGRIEKLGIPIIECADYMETSPLGRAEWMRFFGLLFGHEKQAAALFDEVRENYDSLKMLVSGVEKKPGVLSELRNGSAWYMPGGRSTLGRLYADAGADYMWADDTHSGSVPLSFETVFDRGRDADFWLFKYNEPADKTLASLRDEYAPYACFKAYREGRVFACNTGKVPFYEETPFRPDWLLKDLISIFHPECLPGDTTRYFKRLNP